MQSHYGASTNSKRETLKSSQQAAAAEPFVERHIQMSEQTRGAKPPRVRKYAQTARGDQELTTSSSTQNVPRQSRSNVKANVRLETTTVQASTAGGDLKS
jgi:hypothetical protein